MAKIRMALLAGLLVGCAAANGPQTEEPIIGQTVVVGNEERGGLAPATPTPTSNTTANATPTPTPTPNATSNSTATTAPTSNATATSPPSPAFSIIFADEAPFRTDVRPRLDPPPQTARHAKRTKKRGAKKHPKSSRPYHPAPGIIVEVLSAEGVSAADVQRVARAEGYWPFRRCYEEGLRRNQELAGKVTFELLVGDGATIERARKLSATLQDDSVAACVVREGWHLPFAKVPGADGAKRVEIQVTLATGDEPVPAPRPMPDAERVREALRAKWPAVEACYLEGLSKRPDLGGRITLRFRARASGEVLEVGEATTRFADADVVQCIVAAHRGISLPKLSQDETFLYALHLEAAPAEGAP